MIELRHEDLARKYQAVTDLAGALGIENRTIEG